MSDPDLSALADEVSAAVAGALSGREDAPHVLFCGPAIRLVDLDDRNTYAVGLRVVAEDVTRRLGLTRRSLCWVRPEPSDEAWLGPDVRLVLDRLVEAHAMSAVVLVPVDLGAAGWRLPKPVLTEASRLGIVATVAAGP